MREGHPQRGHQAPVRHGRPAFRHGRTAWFAGCAATFVALLGPIDAAAKIGLLDGLKAPGLSAEDNESLGSPPDPTGSVSREHYVEVVNARIAVYERTRLRRPVSEMDATAFWDATESPIVDPQIAWDDRARRW